MLKRRRRKERPRLRWLEDVEKMKKKGKTYIEMVGRCWKDEEERKDL